MDKLNQETLRPVDKLDKQIWQMTKAEYEARFGAPKGTSTVTGSFSKHKSAVEIAINRGLKVPEIVLRDYPDLANAL